MDKKFKGVYTELYGLDEKVNVDEQALRRLIRFQLDDCKVMASSLRLNGEFAFMTPQNSNRLSPSPLTRLKEWCLFLPDPLRVQPAR